MIVPAASIGTVGWWLVPPAWRSCSDSVFPILLRLLAITKCAIAHPIVLFFNNSDKDTADGDFSRVKTRLAMHFKRHLEDQVGYVDVKNSKTLAEFGNSQMAKPGPKAKLHSRTFIDMKAEEVLERKEEVGDVRKLAGIKARYEYICLPDGQVGC